jgi:O-antigen ligase
MITPVVEEYTFYVGAALALSLLAVFAIGTAMEAEARFRRYAVPALYPLILIAAGVATLLSGRDVSLISDIAALSGSIKDPLGASRWVARMATLTVLAICGARVLAAAVTKENRNAGGAGLFVAFGLFLLGNNVLNSAFGAVPGFVHYHLYPALLFTAVFVSRTQDTDTAVRFFIWGLFAYLGGSCLVALIHPVLAVQQNYQGWLPEVTIRFWGLGSHPNSIGPLALLFLLLLMHRPFAARALQWLAVGIGLTVLVLSQSKTTWFAALLALPLLAVLQHYADGRRRLVRPSSTALGSGLVEFAIVAGSVLATIGVTAAIAYGPARLMGDDVTAQVQTLSGRDVIWVTALYEWMQNPIFGYGVSVWGSEFRYRTGLDYAVHAHNQFFQSLSAAGLVGFIGLAIYVIALLAYSVRAQRATRGLSLVLALLVLARSITETPLSLTGLSPELLTHLLLFHLALVHGRQSATLHRRARTTPALQGAS